MVNVITFCKDLSVGPPYAPQTFLARTPGTQETKPSCGSVLIGTLDQEQGQAETPRDM